MRIPTGFSAGCRIRGAAAVVATTAVIVLPAVAHAQRGGDFVKSESPGATPRDGFPGMFDTHMLEEGGVVISAPIPRLDYGVSDWMSVGLHVHPRISLDDEFPPGAIGRLRMRLHSDESWSSAVTVMAGYGRGGGSDYVGGAATKTLSYAFSPEHRLSASAFGVALRRSESDDRLHVSALGFAVDHDIFFNENFGLNATLLVAPIVGARESSPFEELAKFGLGLETRTFLRALAAIKPAEDWLLQVGGMASADFDVAIPWLEVAKRW